MDVTSTNDVAIWAPEALSISGSIVNATSPEGNNGVLAQGTEDNSISITDSWISTTGDESFDGNIDDSVLFNGTTGKVIGDAAVPGDVTIAEEATLTIPEGASLTVPESVTLTNNGTIVKDGSVTVTGTVQCAEGNHVGGTATCKDKAKCELCGEEYGELAQHILVKTEAKPATSSTAGNITYWTCSVCGKLFSDEDAQNEISQDQTVIPATGGYYPSAPSVQKPTVETSEGVTASLNSTGTTASITVADGYELVDVTVNGVSKGAVTTLTGLKTGDKVVITAQKITSADDDAALIEAVKNTRLVARSMYAKAPSGKKSIKVYWFNKDGSALNFDGYEVYRSLKKDSGYGTKPIFKTTKARYYNTAIKKGTKYYYKVRAYKMINGEKVYTQYSLKAWRTAK